MNTFRGAFVELGDVRWVDAFREGQVNRGRKVT